MTKSFKLLPPVIDEFISIEIPSVKALPGRGAPKIPVSQLNEKEAQDYADDIKEAFLAFWRRKTQPKKPIKKAAPKTQRRK